MGHFNYVLKLTRAQKELDRDIVTFEYVWLD